jgi:WD40 repeat protein
MLKMKRFCLITWGLAILLMALSSCLGEKQLAAEPIHPENAARLQAANRTEMQSVTDLSWSPDGSAILAVSVQGATRLNAGTLEAIDTFTFEKPAFLLDASPDGKTVAFSSDSMNLFLTDISAPQNALTIQPGTILSGADFSPDGLSLAISSEEEIEVQLWDATTGKEIGTYTGFETAAPVYAAQYGADGLHIIWISRGTVQLMDTSNGQLGPVFDHEDFVMDAALTPDGALLATAAAGTVDDNFTPAIFLWDTASGEQLGILVYPETFSRLAFCPDGSLIAAASGSRLTIWDAGNSQLLAELDGHTDRITSLAFSPDGSTIATASADGSLVLWQVPGN